MQREKEIYLQLQYEPLKGLESLLKDYTGLVYTIVSGRLSSYFKKEDIEETVSDIFYEVYEKRDMIDLEKGTIKSYLALIAKRRAIDIYRKKIKESNEVSLDQFDHTWLLSDENIEEDLIKEEEKDKVLSAIYSLEDLDRQIVIRKYYLNQKSKEIGSALGLKENTINKRASRALVKLKETLGGI